MPRVDSTARIVWGRGFSFRGVHGLVVLRYREGGGVVVSSHRVGEVAWAGDGLV